MPDKNSIEEEPTVDEEIIDLLEVVKPGKVPEEGTEEGDVVDFSSHLDSMLEELAKHEGADAEKGSDDQPFPDPTPVDHEVDPNEELPMPSMEDLDNLLESLSPGDTESSDGQTPPSAPEDMQKSDSLDEKKNESLDDELDASSSHEEADKKDSDGDSFTAEFVIDEAINKETTEETDTATQSQESFNAENTTPSDIPLDTDGLFTEEESSSPQAMKEQHHEEPVAPEGITSPSPIQPQEAIATEQQDVPAEETIEAPIETDISVATKAETPCDTGIDIPTEIDPLIPSSPDADSRSGETEKKQSNASEQMSDSLEGQAIDSVTEDPQPSDISSDVVENHDTTFDSTLKHSKEEVASSAKAEVPADDIHSLPESEKNVTTPSEFLQESEIGSSNGEEDSLEEELEKDEVDLNELDAILDDMLSTAPPAGEGLSGESNAQNVPSDEPKIKEPEKLSTDKDSISPEASDNLASSLAIIEEVKFLVSEFQDKLSKKEAVIAELTKTVKDQAEKLQSLQVTLEGRGQEDGLLSLRIEKLELELDKKVAKVAAKVIREEIEAILSAGE